MPSIDDTGDPYYPFGAAVNNTYTDSDVDEARKLTPFTPVPTASDGERAPWWQGAIMYGITKAIDNTFPGDPTIGIQGNTRPGSFAGQNGRSYNQRGGQNAPPTLAGLVGSSGVGNLNIVTLLVIGVVGYILLK